MMARIYSNKTQYGNGKEQTFRPIEKKRRFRNKSTQSKSLNFNKSVKNIHSKEDSLFHNGKTRYPHMEE